MSVRGRTWAPRQGALPSAAATPAGADGSASSLYGIRCCAGASTGSGGGVARYRVVNGPAVRGSEGRLLAGAADRDRPWIGGAGPPGPSATVAGTVPAAGRSTGTMPGTSGLGDSGRRVAERRADLVDLQLDDGALLALLRLEGALLEAALCHHP